MAQTKNSLILLLGGVITMLSCGSIFALEQSNFFVGLDVLKTNYSTKSGYGSNVFGKDPVAANLFVGYKLPHNLYLELGYERTKSKRRSTRAEAGDYLPGGTLLIPGEWTDFNSKIKVEHPYLGLGINYNLVAFPKIILSALAGLSITKVKASYTIPEDDQVIYNPPIYRSFSKRSLIPLLKIVASYKISQHVSMRITGEWHKMSKFKIKPDQQTTAPCEIRVKNGSTAGVGFVYLF